MLWIKQSRRIVVFASTSRNVNATKSKSFMLPLAVCHNFVYMRARIYFHEIHFFSYLCPFCSFLLTMIFSSSIQSFFCRVDFAFVLIFLVFNFSLHKMKYVTKIKNEEEEQEEILEKWRRKNEWKLLSLFTV